MNDARPLTPLVHERASIFKCKQTHIPWSQRTRKIWLHNDVVRATFYLTSPVFYKLSCLKDAVKFSNNNCSSTTTNNNIRNNNNNLFYFLMIEHSNNR